jgi:hypothetical protein
MSALRSERAETGRYQGCGNGLVQLGVWRVVSGDERVVGLVGAFTMSAVALFLGTTVVQKSSRGDGRRVDLSIDFNSRWSEFLLLSFLYEFTLSLSRTGEDSFFVSKYTLHITSSPLWP